MYIAPGIRAERWRALKLEDSESPDWKEAVEIFEKRVRARYLEPVDVLIRMDEQRSVTERQVGFTVLAIDCLLVEMLQAFRLGRKDTRGESERMFRCFLTERPRFGKYFDEKLASEFFRKVRCGILHQAEVRGGWRVWSVGSLLVETRSGYIINRTRFHEGVVGELEDYQNDLRDGKDPGLRKCFRAKMNYICAPV